MSYLRVTIRLFICCLLDSTSLWAILSVWSLIFSGLPIWAKIEVSSTCLMLDEITWDGGEVVDAAAGRRRIHVREMKDGERHR
jgi:hypothetical protein